MARDNFFGDDMTVSVVTDDGTSIDVGSLQSVDIQVTAEHVELQEADTTLWTDVRKRNFGVDLTIGIAAFDEELLQQWLSGDGSVVDGSYTDTSEVRQFDVTGTLKPADGGSNVEATVEDVYFPSLPAIVSTLGEWVTHDLTGRGRTIDYDRAA